VSSKAPVPRICVSLDEAAERLSMSRDHLERYVRGELRVVRSGRKVLVRVAELERWAASHEALTLP
jgi:excisionase family DNA binding protein